MLRSVGGIIEPNEATKARRNEGTTSKKKNKKGGGRNKSIKRPSLAELLLAEEEGRDLKSRRGEAKAKY